MGTDAQNEANRRNAQESTGPRTAHGKSVSRMNALKHGLTAISVVIPGEDPAEFETLRSAIRDVLRPVGWRESEIVERVTAYIWRLRRTFRAEGGIYLVQQAKVELQSAQRKIQKLEDDSSILRDFDITDKEKVTEARGLESAAHRDLEMASKLLGAAFIEDARGENAFSKLSRYETAMELSLRRLFHDLDRLQTERKAAGDQEDAEPLTIDMPVTSEKEST